MSRFILQLSIDLVDAFDWKVTAVTAIYPDRNICDKLSNLCFVRCQKNIVFYNNTFKPFKCDS